MRKLSLSPNLSIHNPLFPSTPPKGLAEVLHVLLLCLCIGSSIWWASHPELLNFSDIIDKSSTCPDFVDRLREICMVRDHGREVIFLSCNDILEREMKKVEGVEYKEMVEAGVKETRSSLLFNYK